MLLTRHGKISGLYLPLEDASRVPDDLRRKLAAVLGGHLSRLLDLPRLSARYGLPEDLVQRQWHLLPVVLHAETEPGVPAR